MIDSPPARYSVSILCFDSIQPDGSRGSRNLIFRDELYRRTPFGALKIISFVRYLAKYQPIALRSFTFSIKTILPPPKRAHFSEIHP
jgi:hypothetical protein